jgi:E3 ubiquitin-protein ligase RNF5
VLINVFNFYVIYRDFAGFSEMGSGFGESTSGVPQNPSFTSSNGNGDAGDFECNICFDLAQDPIVTLCGHLFCWPCLYKWLHFHSKSRECPVCKALVEEEKLVPLYGRGKTSTDPRSKSIPGVNIPNRPAGQRPETAPPPEPNHFGQHGFGLTGGLGGFAPTATARSGNFTFSAAFGGLIPSLFNLQVHGFPNAAMYGPAAGFPYGFHSFHGGHPRGYHRHQGQGQQDYYLKRLLLFIGFCVLLALVWQ